MERLFYLPLRGDTLPPEQLHDVESVFFESRDRTRLHGWFIPALGTVPGSKAPTILHVHGNAGNIESHVAFSAWLAPAGFNVFIFDYRGYGRSAGSARSRGPLIEDTEAALDALLRHPAVDPARIGMYGQSLGGAIGLDVMARRPEIRAAVIESAFASWRDIAANAVAGDPPNAGARALAAVLISDAHRPEDAVRRIDRPILILHGSDDSIVPVSHGRRLAAAAPHARLVEVPGGEHNSLRFEHPEVDRVTVEFLRENLGGVTK
jgi:dipeptidyl aminopeptidase/acylaminoacyl peptidase